MVSIASSAFRRTDGQQYSIWSRGEEIPRVCLMLLQVRPLLPELKLCCISGSSVDETIVRDKFRVRDSFPPLHVKHMPTHLCSRWSGRRLKVEERLKVET